MHADFYNPFGVRYKQSFKKSERPSYNNASNKALRKDTVPTFWEEQRRGFKLGTRVHRDNSEYDEISALLGGSTFFNPYNLNKFLRTPITLTRKRFKRDPFGNIDYDGNGKPRVTKEDPFQVTITDIIGKIFRACQTIQSGSTQETDHQSIYHAQSWLNAIMEQAPANLRQRRFIRRLQDSVSAITSAINSINDGDRQSFKRLLTAAREFQNIYRTMIGGVMSAGIQDIQPAPPGSFGDTTHVRDGIGDPEIPQDDQVADQVNEMRSVADNAIKNETIAAMIQQLNKMKSEQQAALLELRKVGAMFDENYYIDPNDPDVTMALSDIDKTFNLDPSKRKTLEDIKELEEFEEKASQKTETTSTSLAERAKILPSPAERARMIQATTKAQILKYHQMLKQIRQRKSDMDEHRQVLDDIINNRDESLSQKERYLLSIKLRNFAKNYNIMNDIQSRTGLGAIFARDDEKDGDELLDMDNLNISAIQVKAEPADNITAINFLIKNVVDRTQGLLITKLLTALRSVLQRRRRFPLTHDAFRTIASMVAARQNAIVGITLEFFMLKINTEGFGDTFEAKANSMINFLKYKIDDGDRIDDDVKDKNIEKWIIELIGVAYSSGNVELTTLEYDPNRSSQLTFDEGDIKQDDGDFSEDLKREELEDRPPPIKTEQKPKKVFDPRYLRKRRRLDLINNNAAALNIGEDIQRLIKKPPKREDPVKKHKSFMTIRRERQERQRRANQSYLRLMEQAGMKVEQKEDKRPDHKELQYEAGRNEDLDEDFGTWLNRQDWDFDNKNDVPDAINQQNILQPNIADQQNTLALLQAQPNLDLQQRIQLENIQAQGQPQPHPEQQPFRQGYEQPLPPPPPSVPPSLERPSTPSTQPPSATPSIQPPGAPDPDQTMISKMSEESEEKKDVLEEKKEDRPIEEVAKNRTNYWGEGTIPAEGKIWRIDINEISKFTRLEAEAGNAESIAIKLVPVPGYFRVNLEPGAVQAKIKQELAGVSEKIVPRVMLKNEAAADSFISFQGNALVTMLSLLKQDEREAQKNPVWEKSEWRPLLLQLPEVLRKHCNSVNWKVEIDQGSLTRETFLGNLYPYEGWGNFKKYFLGLLPYSGLMRKIGTHKYNVFPWALDTVIFMFKIMKQEWTIPSLAFEAFAQTNNKDTEKAIMNATPYFLLAPNLRNKNNAVQLFNIIVVLGRSALNPTPGFQQFGFGESNYKELFDKWVAGKIAFKLGGYKHTLLTIAGPSEIKQYVQLGALYINQPSWLNLLIRLEIGQPRALVKNIDYHEWYQNFNRTFAYLDPEKDYGEADVTFVDDQL